MGSTVNNHDDLFILNDIRLTIAPTAIKITKDSFNNQWQTLRTNTSQKTKSGHSTVTIEFTVPFVGDDVFNKLKPLVAQLRYMPFCFAENQFLRENLFPQEKQDVTGGTVIDSSTIVLAMRGISITARPDTPGTIWATFQFAYFNYLPYTPYWQYKTDLFGPDADKTVTFPAESKAWQKFVAPVVNKQTASTVPEGQAKISFLEIRTAPINSVESFNQTKEVLTSISKDQKAFFDNFRKSVSDTPDDAIVDAVRDTFPQYKNLKEVAAADLLGPLLINAGPNSNPLSKRYRADGQYIDQTELKRTLAEMDQRVLAKQDIENQLKNSKQDGFEQINGLDFQDNRGSGFGVFRRIRELDLNAHNGIIIESITISVQNILATIPLIGHKYATFQHIGSIDASVYFDIKVISDEAMTDLSWGYDTINDNLLNNRHIPQGMQTIRIDNDILALFNLEEFMTQDFETQTIEGSPGTYQVKLSFIESGIKNEDRLDSPPNEKFNIEYAASDVRVAREIIRVLNANVKTQTNKQWLGKDKTYFISNVNAQRSSRLAAIVDKYIGNGDPNQFAKAALGIDNKGRIPGGNLNGGSDASLLSFFSDDKTEEPSAATISSRSALNLFTDEVSDLIFNGSTSLPDNAPSFFSTAGSTQYFNVLMGMTEQDVPGITKVQEVIFARTKQKGKLNTEITSLSNKPLSDVLAEKRDRIARGTRIEQIRKEKELFNKINFDPSDLSFTDSLTGISDAPPSTIEGEVFNDLLKNSVETLLKTKPFIRWAEFVANLTTAIIETDDIELPEFANAKKLISELRLGRGLPAYADFQLENILPESDRKDVDKVLSLDPDCYLFTPTSMSSDDFIDPALIANAKRVAQTSVDSAMTQIDKHYNDSWWPNFISDSIRDRMTQNIKATVTEHGSDGSKSVSPSQDIDNYYRKGTTQGLYSNAGSGNTRITLGALALDPKQIHSSTSSPVDMLITRSINHSLNPMDIFKFEQKDTSVSKDVNQPDLKKIDNKLGKPVSKSQIGHDGIVTDDPQVLASSAGTDLDTYSIARCIASEDSAANETTKIAVGWAIKNAASARRRTVSEHLLRGDYKSGLFGHGGGRDAATHRDPHEGDLRIAKLVALNKVPDPTGGATQWDHPHAQNSAEFKEAIATLDVSQGRKPRRVLPVDQLIQKRAKKGSVVVDVPGTDPAHIIFFKHTGQRLPAYTPPRPSTPSPDTGITAGVNVADLSIQAFQSSIRNGQGLRMVRAFPAFKLYFIQDNSGNRRRFGLDDFFSYNAVVDIICIRSRKIPADLLEITLTNVSGVLSNRKFKGPRDAINGDISQEAIGVDGAPLEKDPNDFLNANTNSSKNQLASMMLQSGVDVELRLGYANDPDRLTTVFDGKIMEVEFSDSDDLVRVICQSHAIELVQDIKGMTEPDEKSGFFISDARTDILLEKLMAEPEVLHFGRWIRSGAFDSDGNTNRSLLTNKFRLSPSPQDDNIFVPPIEKLRELDPGFFFSGIKYSMYQTTVWDVFNEMTLRHPGWIKSAVPYKGKEGPRMTMFFGLPSQLYFASDPSKEEKSAGAKLRKEVEAYNSNLEQLKKTVGVLNPNMFEVKDFYPKDPLGSHPHLALKSDQLNPVDFAAKRLELARDFQTIRPFRSYHLVTSKQHIISNNIRASAKGTHNTVSIQYGKSSFNKEIKQLVQEGDDVLTLSVDAALPDEEVRELFAQYPNCQSELIAKNYATALLMRELKEVYRGELTIIGNPEVKPYDIVYIFDDYSDIMGPVEVEQVVHRFSQDTGFITEITPDLFVTANEWVNMTVTDMMSIVMEGAASALTHGTPTTTESVVSSPLTKAAALGAFALTLGASPLIAIVGAGAAIGGYFMMQKMVDFTSHGQPVVIHPLIHRGKPWVAGLPLDKLNNLWSTNKGQWLKEAAEGLDLWLDDFGDKLVFAAGQGSNFNLFTTSNVGPKF